MPFWRKNIGEMAYCDNPVALDIFYASEAKIKRQEVNGLCFDLLNLSGGKDISIIDLQELCSLFPTENLPGQKEAAGQ
jgi:hypothetical protein